jgi:hypothetical protein
MTPLLAGTSALVTVAPPTITLSPSTLMASDWPLTVFASLSLTTSAAFTFPATTW